MKMTTICICIHLRRRRCRQKCYCQFRPIAQYCSTLLTESHTSHVPCNANHSNNTNCVYKWSFLHRLMEQYSLACQGLRGSDSLCSAADPLVSEKESLKGAWFGHAFVLFSIVTSNWSFLIPCIIRFTNSGGQSMFELLGTRRIEVPHNRRPKKYVETCSLIPFRVFTASVRSCLLSYFCNSTTVTCYFPNNYTVKMNYSINFKHMHEHL